MRKDRLPFQSVVFVTAVERKEWITLTVARARVISFRLSMHPLIGLHAVLGELGALAFLWVRARQASALPAASPPPAAVFRSARCKCARDSDHSPSTEIGRNTAR